MPPRRYLLLLAIPAALLVLLLPLPAPVLDLLLIASTGLAAALLYRAASAPSLPALPRFPGWLLGGLLLHLLLVIAAIRLVLSRGNAGAVAGLITGLLDDSVPAALALCAVAGLVLYLVLARGGERVAEVLARFALDALPGRQAAIDADLRAAAVAPERARTLRERLLLESRLYGAMDGALRFVRGEVAFSLLALLLALPFSVWLGVAESGLPVAEAAERSALLLSGAGLVLLLPLLCLCAAAALLLSGSAPAEAAGASPRLVVRAGADLGLTRAQVEQALAPLHGLGLSPVLPAPVLEPAPGRLLQIRYATTQLFSRTLSEDEAPQEALAAVLVSSAPELLGIDEVQVLLEGLAAREGQPTLVREVVPRRLDLPQLLLVLRQLLRERVPLDLRAVLCAVAALPETARAPDTIYEAVRAGLGPALVQGYLDPEGALLAIVVEPEIEETLAEARRPGGLPALEPDLRDDLLAACAAAREEAPQGVLLCQGAARGVLVQVLQAEPDPPPVVSYGELSPRLPLQVVGRLTPGGFVSAHASSAS